MKRLSVILSVFAFGLLTARAEGEASPAVPVPPPAAPAAQVITPPVAKEPEEDGIRAAMRRRLASVAATITGNHAPLSDVTERDTIITGLQAQITSLTAQVTTLQGQLVAQADEAANYLAGVMRGQINPVTTPPASVAAKTLVDATSAGTAAAISKIGVPVEDLENGQKPAVDPVKLEGRALMQYAFDQAAKAVPAGAN